MVWNQPSDNGQDRDPWGSNTGKDKSKKPEGKSASPLFPSFKKELNKLLKLGKRGHKFRRSVKPLNTKSLFIPIALVLVAGWIGSGLYTIPSGQMAVITRFGKVHSQITAEGLNWAPKFIDQVYLVNTGKIRELNYSDILLTSDANLVQFTVNINYQVTHVENYLFNVAQPDSTLQEILESASNLLVAQSTMHNLFMESKSSLDTLLQTALINDLAPYHLGITINSVSITGLKEPSELGNVVKSVNSAQDNAAKTVIQSQQTADKTLAQAQLQAQKIVADAYLYQERSVQKTQAQIEKYSQLLPEYKVEPKLVKDKLYFDAMQRVLSKTNKVLLDGENRALIVLPVGKLNKMTEHSSVKNTVQPITTSTQSTIQSNTAAESQSVKSNRGLSIFEQRAKNVKRLSNGAKGE